LRFAFGLTAGGYGQIAARRHVVEDRSVAGGALVRFYIARTDADGDGFAFAFGGGDCDDTDPAIYPGAPDRRGDGIDADCFAGDGSPTVAPLGDGDFGVVPAAVPPRPNVLLLSVDTLRPDHLGYRGYARETSPHIDAFAATAQRFDANRAQSTRSIRSMSSMMTGLYPSQIRYGGEIEWVSIDPRNQTLAERLSAAGWQTGASMGSDYFARSHGFFQGFDEVEQASTRSRQAPVQVGLRMMERFAEADAPWLLWIHLMNVHGPYLPDGLTSRFGDDAFAAYDEEVFLADEQVGRVLARLEELGEADDTVVVMFSDHGEAFGEHGTYGHAQTLYEEELQALLLVRVPGLPPRVIEERTGLIDVFATLLNLTRQSPPGPIASKSLLPLMTGATEGWPERALLAELLPDGRFPFDRKVLFDGDHKLHWWVRENRHALFDLSVDPGETEDLADDDPERAARMLGLLRAWTSGNTLPEHQRQIGRASCRERV
jgi:arylsulfatase A-like enzyme